MLHTNKKENHSNVEFKYKSSHVQNMQLISLFCVIFFSSFLFYLYNKSGYLRVETFLHIPLIIGMLIMFLTIDKLVVIKFINNQVRIKRGLISPRTFLNPEDIKDIALEKKNIIFSRNSGSDIKLESRYFEEKDVENIVSSILAFKESAQEPDKLLNS